MAELDLQTDARRLAAGLLASALLLLFALGLAGARALGAGPAGSIEQERGALGDLERCITCHPREQLTATPGSAHADHRGAKLGCVACHGGVGRALEQRVAHALAPEAGAPEDPLQRSPGRGAACGRCHPPGVPGTEALARGAFTYLRLGCAVCHPLSEDGRGGESFGPDLRGLGRRPEAELRRAILEPEQAAGPAQSAMPAFARSFGEEDPDLAELLLFLAGLALERPREGNLHPILRPRVEAPCTDCHAPPAGVARGSFAHRCSYFEAREAELRCAGCHDALDPGATDPCPVIAAHRSACVICHDGVRAGEVAP